MVTKALPDHRPKVHTRDRQYFTDAQIAAIRDRFGFKDSALLSSAVEHYAWWFHTYPEGTMSGLATLLKSAPPPANSANPADLSTGLAALARLARGRVLQRCSNRGGRRSSTCWTEPLRTQYSWRTDDEDPEFVVLALAIRDVGTCELSIPHERYDAFELIEILGTMKCA